MKKFTLSEETTEQLVESVGRAQLYEELEEAPTKYPRYLKAVRVTMISLGFDEIWVETTFRDALDRKYLGE